MDNAIRAFQTFGLTSSFILSDINIGTSLVTLPILYIRNPSISTPFLYKLHYKGDATLIIFSIISGLASITAAYVYPCKRTLCTVAATMSQLRWTLLVMIKTNVRLRELVDSVSLAKTVDQMDVVALLHKWAWMNLVRGCLPLFGGLMGVYALVSG